MGQLFKFQKFCGTAAIKQLYFIDIHDLAAAFISLELKGAEFIKNDFAAKRLLENVDMDILKN